MEAHPERFPLNARAAVKLLGGQTKASATIGCRQATLSSWMNGRTAIPDPTLVAKLASAVGVLPDVLLAGSLDAALAAQRATMPTEGT